MIKSIIAGDASVDLPETQSCAKESQGRESCHNRGGADSPRKSPDLTPFLLRSKEKVEKLEI
jgi:hypothetical protein